jgi:hypothetical protein
MMRIVLVSAFLLFSQYSLAQQVIEATPLSVEDDGTRKIIVKSEKAESSEALSTSPTVPLQETLSSVNSNDGKLKLEDNKEASAIIEKTPVTAMIFFPPQRYLQISIGFLDSKYDKVDPTLDNGSTLSSLNFVADYSQRLQVGMGVEVISDTSGQKIPDNIRALQYRLFVDHHSPMKFASERFEWLTGLALSIGDYGFKKRYINGLGLEVSQRLNEGFLVGLIPGVGVRIYLVERMSLDLIGEYHLYFGKPQTYLGGLAFSPRLNLVF